MKTHTKLVAIVIASLISGSCFAQVLTGQILAKVRSGYWTSLALSMSKDVRFRVTSEVASGTSIVIDNYPPSCKAIFSIEYMYSTPLNSNIATESFLIDLRVDARQLYSLHGTYSGVMGDQFGFVSLSSTPLFSSLITDMKAGNTLRGQISWPNGTSITTLAFPLSGFTASLNRANNACEEYSRQQNQPTPSPFQAPPKSPAAPSVAPASRSADRPI